jgi:outer membrane protein insertion porin family
MIRAVAFVDYGTVEQEITIQADNFRVARLRFRFCPALGPARWHLTSFPVAQADTDETQCSAILRFVLVRWTAPHWR